MTYLDPQLVEHYGKLPTPLTPLGLAIMKRTYANWLPDLKPGADKRRERWHEIIARVVEWSISMYPAGAPITEQQKREEAAELFDVLFHAKAFVAGRTNFAAGKDIPGESHFNCGFMTERTAEDWGDLLALLMAGVGVGGRNDPDSLNKNIPLCAGKPEIKFVGIDIDSPERPARGRENTIIERKTTSYDSHCGFELDPDDVGAPYSVARLDIGDSREGWRDALVYFFRWLPFVYYWEIDDSQLRKFGAKLNRMGGFASGPGPFREALKNILDVLYRDDKGWTSVKATEVRNILGQLAVAAGTRRSAEISLDDQQDKDFIQMKLPEHFGYVDGKPTKNIWRYQSNNSVMFFEKPSLETIEKYLHTAYLSGEPGFINGAAGLARRHDFRGLNPCAEILLTDKEFCNLITQNLPKFVTADKKIDRKALTRSIQLMIRHNLRVTFAQLSPYLTEWQRNLERDRLLGASFTGLYDLLGQVPMNKQDLKELLNYMRYVAHDEAIKLSYDLRVPTPLLITTVKPEGTLSKLTDSSSGIHPKYAPYYIQRFTVTKHDAVHDALVWAGVPHEDKLGDPAASMFEFPMRGEGLVHAKTIKAIEQLEMYKLVMEEYVDHNASVTVYISEDEIPHVARWLHQNWDSYVGVSFFAKVEGTFKQAPWEEIDYKEYHRRMGELQGFPEIFEAALTEMERTKGNSAVEEFEACDTGACPVR